MRRIIPLKNRVSIRTQHTQSSEHAHHWPLLQRILLVSLSKGLNRGVRTGIALHLREVHPPKICIAKHFTPALRVSVDAASHLLHILRLRMPQATANEGAAWLAVNIVHCIRPFAPCS